MAKKNNVDVEQYLPNELKWAYNPGGDEEDEEETEFLTIKDENGVERECQILCIYEIEELKQDYIALLPLDQLEGVEEDTDTDAEVFFYRFTENGDDIEFSTLESDEEFNVVREVFEQIMEEDE